MNSISEQSGSSNHKLESIFIRPGEQTPSQKQKMTFKEEMKLRNIGAEMILEAGFSLRLPWYTISTSQAIFHRFYYRQVTSSAKLQIRASFIEYDIKDIVMGSIFLGTKLEESIRKVRDIVSVCYQIFKVTIFNKYNQQIREGVQRPYPVLNLSSNYYQLMRSIVIESERVILKELGFELYRVSDHAHKYLLYYLKTVRVPKEVSHQAWALINDSYRLTTCMNYPPHELATACLYLAIRQERASMPNCIWWAIFDTSMKHILEICSDLLELQELSTMNMKDVKIIMDSCFKRNNMDDNEYVIDNEAEFEKEREIESLQLEQERIQESANSRKIEVKKLRSRSIDRTYQGKDDHKKKFDKKKKKKRSQSQKRKRKEHRRSTSRSTISEDEREKKKKKKKKKRSESSSRSRSRSHSRKKYRRGGRSSSRRRDGSDQKKRESLEYDQNMDKDKSKAKKEYPDKKGDFGERPKLERKNTLEELNEEVLKSEFNEHQKQEKKIVIERDEKILEFKEAIQDNVNKKSMIEALKASVLATVKEPISINPMPKDIHALKINSSENKDSQLMGTYKNAENDEDEDKLKELRQKVLENKSKLKKKV